jgi:hypothetical protein
MLATEARAIARQWVEEEASNTAGFAGAFFMGSTNFLPDKAGFPATSDIDITIVLDTSSVPEVVRKVAYRGVVLDTSYSSLEEVRSAETVLANYYLACHLARPSIIADPTGTLRRIQPVVSREYAKREWVTRRCEHARDWLLTSLTWLDGAEPLHDQVFAWLYATSLPSHIVLVADLQNPTTRKALVASQGVLARYGHLSLHQSLLDLLGSATMSREKAEALLVSCADAFDTAKMIVTTPFSVTRQSRTWLDQWQSTALGSSSRRDFIGRRCFGWLSSIPGVRKPFTMTLPTSSEPATCQAMSISWRNLASLVPQI